MKVLTVKSSGLLSESMQTEVHHSFGMEHYTDYVLTPRGDQKYSATIVLEDSGTVIGNIIEASTKFPGNEFIIDDLDMDQNSVDRYLVKEGKVTRKLQAGWDWEK